MNAEPCKKRFPLTGPEKQKMGLYPVKRWAICLDPDRPNKGLILVCPCKNCGPKCSGYAIEGVSGNPPTVTVIRAASEHISENVKTTVGAESPQ